MRKLLNVLYVTVQGAYLAKDGETVVVRVEQETRLRLPIHTLEGIVCFGVVSMSPALMGYCAEKMSASASLPNTDDFWRACKDR